MEPICAIATPPGGAIGLIRTSGDEAIALTGKLFRGSDLQRAESHTIHFGQIVVEGEVVDEVLVSVFRAPHSYTGEDCTEISTHGSPYIMVRILAALENVGMRLAQRGEYTKRAFLAGRMDLAEAEAVADLIASESREQHRLAMTQMRGQYSRHLKGLRDQLLHLTALLELELDFAEEDVEFAQRTQLLTLACDLESELLRLTHSFASGGAIRKGIPVCILGAPNVGKSTLLNQLVGDERAIVSPLEGTTRDLVEDTAIIQGFLFRFIDTAGLRHTADTIERLGIARSHQAAQRAKIIILLREPGVPYPDIEARPDQTVIRIENKTASFQALTGLGLDSLKDQLAKAVPQATAEAPLVCNQRHHEALRHALTDVGRAINGLKTGQSTDLIAEDLRHALRHLGEILGEITNDEVLTHIFEGFCVGK